MDKLKELIKTGKQDDTAAEVQALLDAGETAESILKTGMISAMDEVGELFQSGELFIPEMLSSAKAMKKGMELLRPLLAEGKVEMTGKVVLGTVAGDTHDIGKNLVGMILEGAGFDIIDLGTDVATEDFVDAVREHKPLAVGMSAMLTTTMAEMETVIDALKEAGLRESVKVLIGGAPLSEDFAEEIGADYFGRGPSDGKNYLKKVAACTA